MLPETSKNSTFSGFRTAIRSEEQLEQVKIFVESFLKEEFAINMRKERLGKVVAKLCGYQSIQSLVATFEQYEASSDEANRNTYIIKVADELTMFSNQTAALEFAYEHVAREMLNIIANTPPSEWNNQYEEDDNYPEIGSVTMVEFYKSVVSRKYHNDWQGLLYFMENFMHRDSHIEFSEHPEIISIYTPSDEVFNNTPLMDKLLAIPQKEKEKDVDMNAFFGSPARPGGSSKTKDLKSLLPEENYTGKKPLFAFKTLAAPK